MGCEQSVLQYWPAGGWSILQYSWPTCIVRRFGLCRDTTGVAAGWGSRGACSRRAAGAGARGHRAGVRAARGRVRRACDRQARWQAAGDKLGGAARRGRVERRRADERGARLGAAAGAGRAA